MSRGRLLAVAVLAFVLTGCAAGGRFLATLPEVPGDYAVDAQPVELIDLTGLVTALQPIPDPLLLSDGGFSQASAVSGDPLAIQFVWGAGMCEDRTRLTFEEVETGYSMRVEHDNSVGAMIGCPAAIVYRGVTLRFREAVAPQSIRMSVNNN